MTRTLQELFQAEKPEASSPPAPAPVTTEECTEQGDLSGVVQSSASKEEEENDLEGPPTGSKELPVNVSEGGTEGSPIVGLQQKDCPPSGAEPMTVPKCESDSSEKEGREKSPDFIEIDTSKLVAAADSTEKDCSESQSLASEEKTPSRDDALEKVEASKADEPRRELIPAENGATATEKLQSKENMPAENASTGKHTALKTCPSVGTSLESFDLKDNSSTSNNVNGESVTAMVEEAWERLKKSTVFFKGKPVGTLAAMDPIAESLNYNQVLTFSALLSFCIILRLCKSI